MKKNPFLFVLLFSLFVHSNALAQKPKTDPRPLQGLHTGTIPHYDSMQQYLRAHPPEAGALVRLGATVGKAGLTTASASAPSAMTPLKPSSPSSTLQRAENGTVRWWQNGFAPMASYPDVQMPDVAPKTGSSPTFTRRQIAALQQAYTVLQAHAQVLKLANPVAELAPVRVEDDELGMTHLRFDQYFEGIPIWGRDLYVHLDANGEAKIINGAYEPTPAPNTTTLPRLDAQNALENVVADLVDKHEWKPVNAETAALARISPPQTRLVFFPDGGKIRLAYQVSLHPSFLARYDYFVDAQTGQVITRIRLECAIHPTEKTPVIAPDLSQASAARCSHPFRANA